MINDLIQYLKNKKILILGFGREGQSTYKLIRRHIQDQNLFIADKKEKFYENYSFLNDDKNCTFIDGDNYLENLDDYDIIIKSPGISFVGLDIKNIYSKIKSQLELFLEFFDVTTIGITGTKGKSTTSSLIYKMLQDQNVKSLLLGNIGLPIFDYLDEIENDMTLVLEMSSHQLEFTERSTNISILLNVFEEHLDHYASFEKYAEAKCNIYKYQKESDFFLYNVDNETLNKLVQNPKAKTYKVSISGNKEADIYYDGENVYINNKAVYSKDTPRNIVGDYNLNNIMFVLGVSQILNLDLNKTIKSIGEFKTLAHRLELVGKFDDIYYYDNSIGTIPMATIEAVKALKDVDTLIIGGMDRKLDYTEFIEYLNNCDVRNIICMPKTGHDIAEHLKEEKKYIVETLEEAVETAKRVTQKGKICLLSPAAASYGFFKNFEEKGNLYQELVRK